MHLLLSGISRHLRQSAVVYFAFLAAVVGRGQSAEPAYAFSHLAGSPAGSGNEDGVGRAARFAYPTGMAVDSAGVIYVADTGSRTIRKISRTGVVTTLAGRAGEPGHIDASGATARFEYPQSLAVDSRGNVFVIDNGTLRKITADGEVTTLPRSTWFSDGVGNSSSKHPPCPFGLAVDGSDNLYVADINNNKICRITPVGVVTTFVEISSPQNIAVDAAGNLYVAHWYRYTISKVSPAGVVTTLAGSGIQDGVDGRGALASFYFPQGLAVDAAGNVFVVDGNDYRSSNNTIRKITPDGTVTTLAGSAVEGGYVDGDGPTARFDRPMGVAVDEDGNLYVADTSNETIRKIDSTGAVATFAGTPGDFGATDGTGAAARFGNPEGVAVYGDGTIFVSDTGSHTIRKCTPTGSVTTLAGTAGQPGSIDGTSADARFDTPRGVAVDSAKNVYVADTKNHTIRKITPAGVVTTLAGTRGVPGNLDAVGETASFNEPSGVATDTFGNVFVADTGNRSIRKITPTGVVTTIAGYFRSSAPDGGLNNPAPDGDVIIPVPVGIIGIGHAAQFFHPTALAVDRLGNVYVSDSDSISIVSPTGTVTVLAGRAGQTGDRDGIGANACFSSPQGLALDSAHNVYVADTDNHTIRKITPAGVVTTIGGAGQQGARDGTGPNASFSSPSGVAIDTAGNLFVADMGNSAIRRGVPTMADMATIWSQPMDRTLVAGTGASLNVAASANGSLTYRWYKDGRLIANTTSGTLAFGSVEPGNAGVYDVLASTDSTDMRSRAVVVGVVPPNGSRTAGPVVTRPEWQNVRLANGYVCDQFLLAGAAGTFTAAQGKIARMSFLDLRYSIVQVELSGRGSATVVLAYPYLLSPDDTSFGTPGQPRANGPMRANLYDQSGISYMQGKATIILAGADETTHLSVYSVGTATNPGITFPDGSYPGWADIAVVGVVSTNGKLGGLHLGNVTFASLDNGFAGLLAPTVTSVTSQPVAIGNIYAIARAEPVLSFGENGILQVKIAGGCLGQANGEPVRVGGLQRVTMAAGQDSCGRTAPAQMLATRLVDEAGKDVTAAIVTGP